MNLTWCSIPMILSLYRRFCRPWLCALGLLLGAQPAALAVLTIEVNRGVEAAIPIAVVPFATEGTTAVDPGGDGGDRVRPVRQRAFRSAGPG